jgi:hypothetical protein
MPDWNFQKSLKVELKKIGSEISVPNREREIE